MILTYLFIILAVACYAVSQSVVQGKFTLYPGAFWGIEGWEMKYKSDDKGKLIPAPNNKYYRLIGVKYKERWPTSTWLTVALTDSYHMFQFFFKIFLCLAFVPHIGWIWSAGLWATFGIVFTLVYKYSQK